MSLKASCRNTLDICKKIMHSLNSNQKLSIVSSNEPGDHTDESVAPRKIIDAFSILWSQGLIKLDPATESNMAQLCRQIHMAKHEHNINILLDYVNDIQKFEIPGFKCLYMCNNEKLLFRVNTNGHYVGHYRHHLNIETQSDSVKMHVVSSKVYDEDYIGISTTIENITSIEMLQYIFRSVFLDETKIGNEIALTKNACMHVESVTTKNDNLPRFIKEIQDGYLRTCEIANILDYGIMVYGGTFENRSTPDKILYRFNNIKFSISTTQSDNDGLAIASCVAVSRSLDRIQRTVTFKHIYSMGRLIHIFYFNRLWYAMHDNTEQYGGDGYTKRDLSYCHIDDDDYNPVLREFDDAVSVEIKEIPAVSDPYEARIQRF